MSKRTIISLLHEERDSGLLPGIGYYTKINDSKYEVTNEKGNTYVVEKDNANWHCSCPSFKFSGKGTCKHIDALVREGVISLPIERLPMNIIDDTVIPALDPVMQKYIPDWQDFIVGSYRRKKDTFKDIDIIIPLDVNDFHKLMDDIKSVDGFEFIMGKDDIFRGMFPVGEVNGKERKVELDFSRQNTDSQAGMTLYRTGPACFSSGTQVLTPTGFVNIETIKVGDEVFAGDGTITKVTSLVKYKSNKISIIDAVVPTHCTDEHKHFIGASGTGGRLYKNPHWVQPKDMNRWMGLCYPRLVYPSGPTPTDREAFMLGLYLADGSINLRESTGKCNRYSNNDVENRVWFGNNHCAFDIRISLHKDYLDGYHELFDMLGISYQDLKSSRGNEFTIVVKDPSLIEFCLNHGGVTNKKLSLTKSLDSSVLHWGESARLWLLKGFFLGDGTFGGTSSIEFLNTNKQIIDTLWLVSKTIFYMDTIVTEEKVRSNELPMYKFVIRGVSGRVFIDNLGIIASLKGSKWRKSSRRQILSIVQFDRTDVFTKVIGKPVVTIDSVEDVWDLQVEHSSHSYLVNGYIVHNTLNTFMRQVAQTHGWSLSEKGLIDHITGEKARVPQDTETDIFDTLGIPYLNPEKREHWEDFINAEEFLSNARANNNSRSRDVIYELRDWFRDHPEWKDIGLSLNTKDNANALKARLKTHNSIEHIVKFPYNYEISKAFEYAYDAKLPPNKM